MNNFFPKISHSSGKEPHKSGEGVPCCTFPPLSSTWSGPGWSEASSETHPHAALYKAGPADCSLLHSKPRSCLQRSLSTLCMAVWCWLLLDTYRRRGWHLLQFTRSLSTLHVLKRHCLPTACPGSWILQTWMRSALSVARGTVPNTELSLGGALLHVCSSKGHWGGLGPRYFSPFVGTKATRLWTQPAQAGRRHGGNRGGFWPEGDTARGFC